MLTYHCAFPFVFSEEADFQSRPVADPQGSCSISPSAMLTGIPLCCKFLLLESSAQSGGSGKSGGRVGGGPVIYIHCSSLSQ